MKLLIGANKTPVSDFSASISPPSLTVLPPPGTYISPYFTASAQNGSGNYSYNWFTENNLSTVEILGQGTSRIQMRISQIQTGDFFELKCKVEDQSIAQSETAQSQISIPREL